MKLIPSLLILGLATSSCQSRSFDNDLAETAATASKQITVGGQNGWRHVETNIPGGFFHTFDALKLGNYPTKKIQFFLPNGYEKSEKTYPVIVMNDGHTAFFDNDGRGHKWPKGYWQVGETLSKMYKDGKIKELIVIAVHPISIDKRAMEYTNDKMIPEQTRSECCGLQDYTKYLADDFMPWVQANYRVSKNPKDVMILGASHGGLASTYIALDRPDIFGIAVGMSSSLWVGVDNTYVTVPFVNLKYPIIGVNKFSDSDYYAHMKKKSAVLSDPQKRPTIYLDWGTRKMGDLVADTIEKAARSRSIDLADILVQEFGYTKGKDLETFEDTNGVHDETSWVYRFPTVVQKYFAN